MIDTIKNPATNARGIHKGAITQNQVILAPNNLQASSTINSRGKKPIPPLVATLDIEI